MAGKSQRDSDPLVGFNFALEVDGPVEMKGYFTEVSGLGSEHEVVEHKVVDKDGRELVQKIPGRLKWGDVTCKRGITGDLSFWDWRDIVVKGDLEKARANCSVMMFDRDYKEVARWNFFSAWPQKLSGPTLSAGSNEIGVEELVLVHEGIERVK